MARMTISRRPFPGTWYSQSKKWKTKEYSTILANSMNSFWNGSKRVYKDTTPLNQKPRSATLLGFFFLKINPQSSPGAGPQAIFQQKNSAPGFYLRQARAFCQKSISEGARCGDRDLDPFEIAYNTRNFKRGCALLKEHLKRPHYQISNITSPPNLAFFAWLLVIKPFGVEMMEIPNPPRTFLISVALV